MRKIRPLMLRFLTAVLAGACCTVALIATYTWSMTERLRLLPAWQEALIASAVILIFCFATTALLEAVLTAVGWFRPLRRSYKVAIGTLLFWTVLTLIARSPVFGLMVAPAGFLASLVISREATRPLARRGRLLLGAGLLLWVGLVMAAVLAAQRQHQEAQRESAPSLLGERVLGGAVLGSELWLYNEGGTLASFRADDWKPTVRAEGGVAAIALDGSTLWALAGSRPILRDAVQPAARFRLAANANGLWNFSAWQNVAQGEQPLSLAVSRDKEVVLDPTHLRVFTGLTRPAISVALSRPIERANLVATVLVPPSTLYVGINRGEFGGGLLRVDIGTGKVEQIDRRAGGLLCSGPLNGDCDPVTAVLTDPTRTGCIFASIGLAHMMWTGRVLRVCGDQVETVFEAKVLPIGIRIERALSSRAREFPPQTEPVFGLAPSPRGFVAVTPRALYRWRDGAVVRMPFPKMRSVHGMWLSDEIPGLVVVSTDANAARSMSGVTPLVFVRPSS